MNKLIKKAFTLIELLVVIAIIGILSGLIVVSMGGMTDKASIAKLQVFSNSLRNSLMLDLVSEWKFDQVGSPGTNQTPDSWGGINNCILSDTGGACSTTLCPQLQNNGCVSGNCFSFNGVGQYLDCGYDSSLNIREAITIEAWIKTNQLYTDRWRAIVGKPSFSQYSIFAEWSSGGGFLRFEVDNGATRYPVNGPNFSGNVGKWMHVVGTYNSAEGVLRIYYNGSLYNSYSIGTNKTIDSSSSSHLLIGGYDTSSYFNGMMDGIRIYKAVMTASQIKEQYFIGLNNLLANNSITNKEYSERINSIAQQ